MLHILTGDSQTGKTRWLEARVRELARTGVPCYGVVAPGVWAEKDGALEKRAIENVLLPGGERVTLALPAAPGSAGPLGWEFDAAALARVNDHLRRLRAVAATAAPGLLVIDEIGPLELSLGGGLTEALALLREGPAPAWPDAVVVVRPSLADELAALLAPAWGPSERHRP